MPRVSKRPIDKKKMDQFYEDFWEAVASLETRKEAQSFLYDLLTHTERKMLAKRLQVAVMLIEGYGYETINEEVKVGNSTIARVNNWLNTGAEGLIKVGQRLIDFRDKGDTEPRMNEDRYLAGDLLMPAVESGVKLISRGLKRRSRKKKR